MENGKPGIKQTRDPTIHGGVYLSVKFDTICLRLFVLAGNIHINNDKSSHTVTRLSVPPCYRNRVFETSEGRVIAVGFDGRQIYSPARTVAHDRK